MANSGERNCTCHLLTLQRTQSETRHSATRQARNMQTKQTKYVEQRYKKKLKPFFGKVSFVILTYLYGRGEAWRQSGEKGHTGEATCPHGARREAGRQGNEGRRLALSSPSPPSSRRSSSSSRITHYLPLPATHTHTLTHANAPSISAGQREGERKRDRWSE